MTKPMRDDYEPCIRCGVTPVCNASGVCGPCRTWKCPQCGKEIKQSKWGTRCYVCGREHDRKRAISHQGALV